MLNFLVIGVVIASLVNPVARDDPPTEPPSEAIVIDVMYVNGTGCPPGSAAVAVSPDNSTFVVTFSEHFAQVGVGAQPLEMRRRCQIDIVPHVPAGYTYAIASSDYRGYASLAAGAGATYRIATYFAGQPAQWRQLYTIAGPFADEVSFSAEVDLATTVWAPCRQLRPLTIDTEVQVGAGTSDVRRTHSFAALERADGFTLRWKRCDA